MPDQFGNPTEHEVFQTLQREKAALIATARTRQERTSVNMRIFGKAILGGIDPRLTRAQDITDALQPGASLKRRPDETSLDFSIRQHRRMFKDVQDVDPTTASQVMSQLTVLDAERAEQRHLKADRADELELQRLDIEEKTAKNIFQRRGYAINVITGEQLGSIDTSDGDDAVAAFRAEHGIDSNPDIHFLSYDDAREIGADDLFTDILNKSDFADRLDVLDSQTRLASTSNQLVGVLTAAFDAGTNSLSNVAAAENFLNKQISNLQELENLRGFEDDDGRLHATEPKAAQWLRENSARQNVTSALLTKMAYQLAVAFNRRVTDKDFELAYSMLGGDSGSVGTAINVIRSNLTTENTAVRNSIGVELGTELFQGSNQGKFLQVKYDTYLNEYDDFETQSAALLELSGETILETMDAVERLAAQREQDNAPSAFSQALVHKDN